MSDRKIAPPSKAVAAELPDFRAIAEDAFARGERPRNAPRDEVRAVRALCSMLRQSGTLAARLESAGIQPRLISTAVAIADALDKLLDAAPAERRPTESPRDPGDAREREYIQAAAQRVARAKKAVAAAARHAGDFGDALGFARGAAFSHDNPAEVNEALAHFLCCAQRSPQLVALVGIRAADLTSMAEDEREMRAIAERRKHRDAPRSEAARAVDTLALALGSFFDLYRARVTWALGQEAALCDLAMSVLPRTTERRKLANARQSVSGMSERRWQGESSA